MREITLLDKFNSESDKVFRTAKRYILVAVKIKDKKQDLKNNLLYLFTIVEQTNGNLGILIRYPNSQIYRQFLIDYNLAEKYNKVIEKIKEYLQSDGTGDLAEKILELNKDKSNPIYFVYEIQNVNEFRNVVDYFRIFKQTPLYYYEPKVFTPQSIKEIALELSKVENKAVEQVQEQTNKKLSVKEILLIDKELY